MICLHMLSRGIPQSLLVLLLLNISRVVYEEYTLPSDYLDSEKKNQLLGFCHTAHYRVGTDCILDVVTVVVT